LKNLRLNVQNAENPSKLLHYPLNMLLKAAQNIENLTECENSNPFFSSGCITVPPKTFCPDCGKPLTLEEQPESKFLKDMCVFLGKCENGHRYEVIEDLSDMGRVKLTQVLEIDEACEDGCEEEEDELGGQEVELGQEYN